jgi:hypothetical protein
MDHVNIIPIFGIFMIIAIVIGPIWIRSYFNARDREDMQKTLRAAIDKGQPLPPELIAALQSDTRNEPYFRGPESDLRRGLVLIFTGVGLGLLGFALWFGLGSIAGHHVGDIVGASVAGGGAIPGLIGFAYLLVYYLHRRQPPVL